MIWRSARQRGHRTGIWTGQSRRQFIHTRAGILLEVLLAVALFAGAASFTLGCVKSVFTAFDRTRRLQEAVDLARSKMAELEAGLITLADLRGEAVDSVGSLSMSDSSVSPSTGQPRLVADVKSRRTEFTGLSLVELTVREETSDPRVQADEPMSYTLRQLMPLRSTDAEEFQPDELMEAGDE